MPGDLQQAMQELHGIRNRMMEAENSCDATYFEEIIAEDAVIMAPNMPPIVGAVACLDFIREILRDMYQEFDRRITYVSAEVAVSSDMAFDRGSFSQTLKRRAGGGPVHEGGKYLLLYSRARDGSWKLARSIWNIDESLQEQETEHRS